MQALLILVLAASLAGCAASDAPNQLTTDSTMSSSATTVVRTTCPPNPGYDCAPPISFSKQSNPQGEGGSFQVLSISGLPADTTWANIAITPEGCTLPEGQIRAGDRIPCTHDGPFEITDKRDGYLYYRGEF